MSKLIELVKYSTFLTSTDKEVLGGRLNPDNYSTLYEYYIFIIDNWESINSIKLPSIYQAILSYVLMIYFNFQKFGEFYGKYSTIEVAATYMRVLTRQSQKKKINEIISKFPINEMEEAPIFSQLDLLTWETYFYIYEHDFDKAKELILTAENLISKINEKDEDIILHKHQSASLFYIKALLYDMEKEIQKSLVEIILGIRILEESKIFDSFILGSLYNSYGSSLMTLGSPIAKDKFKTGLSYFSQNKIERGMAVCQANIATLLMHEGKFDEALDYFYDFVIIMEKFQDQRNILVIFNHIYSCLQSLGRMDQAEEYLHKAFKRMEEHNLENDDIFLDASEFYAIEGNFKLAEKHLKKYSEILKVKEEEETLTRATWLIHKGFIELKKKNMYESEQHLLEGIQIAKNNLFAPLSLQGIIYLIELLINKYRTEEDNQSKQNIIDEIELYSQECVILLREYKSNFQMVNYELLLATTYLLSNKLELAWDVLTRTSQVCKQYNFQNQLEKVEKNIIIVQELKSDQKKTKLGKDIIQMRSDIELSMVDYSAKGVKDITILTESDKRPLLIYLLVILPSGLPCYSYNFKTDRISDNELLIAGLINAIQNFSSEISLKKGVFRMLEHSDYIVLLEPRDNFSIAMFTDSFSYELKEHVLDFANSVEKVIDILAEKDFVKAEEVEVITIKLDKLIREIFQSVEIPILNNKHN